MMAHKNGLQTRVSGHYEITTGAIDACLAVCHSFTSTTYPPEKTTNDVEHTVTADAKPAIQTVIKPRREKVYPTELLAAHRGPVYTRLNNTCLSRDGIATNPKRGTHTRTSHPCRTRSHQGKTVHTCEKYISDGLKKFDRYQSIFSTWISRRQYWTSW